MSPRRREQEALESRLAEIVARNLLTTDAGPAIHDLRKAAGEQTALLARFCGEAAGFFVSPKTQILCNAIIEEIDGAEDWAAVGRQRRQRATSRADPSLSER